MVKKQNCVIWIQMFHRIHKKDDTYKDIAEDVQTRFDTSNYELDRPLSKEKNIIVMIIIKYHYNYNSNWINER